MGVNDTDWCKECFLDIKTADMGAFSKAGLCKACYQQSNKSEPKRATIYENEQSSRQDVSLNNNWVIFLIALFLLPPSDFLFFGSSLPYGYFMFLRPLAFVSMVFLAYSAVKSGKKIFDIQYPFIFGGCALLYNPFLPIELTRDIWTIFNCATAGTLIHYNFYAKDMEPDAKFSVDYGRKQPDLDDQLGTLAVSA